MIINTSLGINSALSVQTLIDMRNQLTDLQRQLGTGKKADTYAGLGLDRGLTVGLRSQLSAMTGFSQTITEVGVRLDLASEALTQIDKISRSAKSTAMQSNFALSNGNQTPEQRTAYIQLDQILSVLNTSTGDRYLFSGRGVDRPAVASADVIMNGEGTRAGLKQLIDERRQADLGASGLGRLIVSGPSATSVGLDEDAASPFGFKLARSHHRDCRGHRDRPRGLAGLSNGRSRCHQSEPRRNHSLHLYDAGRLQPGSDADRDDVLTARPQRVRDWRFLGCHCRQSAGGPHPGAHQACIDLAGCGLGDGSLQRLL